MSHEQVLSAVLGEDDVQLVRREELLIDEQLPEERTRLDLLLQGKHPLELSLVDQAALDRSPPSRGWRRGAGGRQRSRSPGRPLRSSRPSSAPGLASEHRRARPGPTVGI